LSAVEFSATESVEGVTSTASLSAGGIEQMRWLDTRGERAAEALSCGKTEGYASPWGGALAAWYRCARPRVRRYLRRLVLRLEGGECFSLTIRRIFLAVHGVEVGLYTHGGCFAPERMQPGTRIGRYSSIAESAMVFGRNHPMNLRSSHAFFFNPRLGVVDRDVIPYHGLTIGNDVWLGHNAIIMPAVSSIGDGAVIGAGAVVHKDIPPYAVVTGNPARVVRYRFSVRTIRELLATRWWEYSITELRPRLAEFQRPLEGDWVR